MDSLFDILFYGLELKTTGIILGVVLIAAHAFAWIKAPEVGEWLRKFPRNKQAGIAILFVDLVWAWIVISKMDLGEFHTVRTILMILLPVAFVLIIQFVDEFLAVRATGAFFLLLACPVLGGAFLEPQASRLLLPALAYVWIAFALFWVGMPYLMRDQITWLLASPGRYRAACFGGLAYGALVLICALTFY